MIKFFRKIRYSLMSENKTGRYFKYAIGEIILVVIGILIAVQINVWYGNKQLEEGNKILLNKMLTELELNKARMHKIANVGVTRWPSLKEAYKNCDSLLRISYRGLKTSDLDFIVNGRFSAGGSYLNIHNSIYEELINTGKLYTLGSDTLITAIKDYYKRCEREDLYNKFNTEDANKGYDLMEKGLLKLELDYHMDSTKFSLDNYPWYFNPSSEDYQNMQIGISKISGGQRSNYIKMNQIKQYTDTLISVINKELKQSQ
ncbi:DUF6090 family protein [Winogradskyella maritima]|uniref:DUF6090 family protein n=1 Tax=Winogradskyella maritima TaxID=1517766 RepID=A0ABV8AGH0_9FLAO|nr:DUF6090 family protein [Winogradskyella maritima]